MDEKELREIAEKRLREWGVKDSDYLSAYSHLGSGVEKVLDTAAPELRRATEYNAEGKIYPWDVDRVLDQTLRNGEVGFLTMSDGKPVFQPAAPRKVEKVE